MARTGIRATAIIVRDEKLLLIHRVKEGSEYWVFPGGGVEEGEDWETTLKREVKEELNMDVLSFELAFMDLNTKDGLEHPYYFCEVAGDKAEIVGEEKDRNTQDNSYQLEWIPLNEIKALNLVPDSAKEKFLAKISS